MRIEIIDLTEENLKDAPEWNAHPFGCKYCLYWEFPEEFLGSTREKKEETMRKKLKWLRDTNEKFGNCGKIVYVDGKAVGYAQYAPPELLPNAANYSAGSSSSDAVLIACLAIVSKEHQGSRLGRQLLQSIIDELRERGTKAVETFARKGNPNNPSGPVEFYTKHGFKVHRNDPEFPLMRLDL